MEESAQEVHLELTKKDKTFVRELIKIHLGINLMTEEDYEASILHPNSYAITKEDDSESEIQVMKKTLIEEVFDQYLKKKTFEPVKQLPLEESDINSDNVIGIKCNENGLEKTVNFENENVSETLKKKQSEMSQEFPFTRNKDYFVNKMVENLPVIEQNNSVAEVEPDCSNLVYSKNPSARFTTLTDEGEDVFKIEENNNNDVFEKFRKSYEPDNSEMKEDKQPLLFNFGVTSPTNDADHQLITKNDAEMDRNNDSYYKTTEVMPGPTTSITKPFIESKIFSNYQKKLTKNELSPTGCLYELCEKCKWPKPLFSCNYSKKESSFMFDVCVRNLSFQGYKWTTNKTSAKHLASAACLEYFGFECPFKEVTPYFITKKRRPFSRKKTEVQTVINSMKGKRSHVHCNSGKNTDKREVENISSDNYTDLRLILDMKRSKRKNPSTTENSLYLGSPDEIGLM